MVEIVVIILVTLTIFCGVVVAYVTVESRQRDLQEMHYEQLHESRVAREALHNERREVQRARRDVDHEIDVILHRYGGEAGREPP